MLSLRAGGRSNPVFRCWMGLLRLKSQPRNDGQLRVKSRCIIWQGQVQPISLINLHSFKCTLRSSKVLRPPLLSAVLAKITGTFLSRHSGTKISSITCLAYSHPGAFALHFKISRAKEEKLFGNFTLAIASSVPSILISRYLYPSSFEGISP